MAAKKQPDLGLRIQRKIMGPRHDLESLPDFWIKPKKYSSEGGEEIRIIQFKMSKGTKTPVITKYLKKLRALGIDNPKIKDVIDNFNEEELAEITEAMYSVEPGSNVELQEKIMLYGTGEHNFAQGGKMLSLEEAMPILMQDAKAVIEIIDIIREWNPPLLQESSRKSSSQHNGSTQKLNSQKTEASQKKN